ncbi:uncharacterized protein LOC100375170 [Saccoglossus kowalevskii]|uniref:Uncharacterized protein LOC100375170 n=1 Tax=Saccoglossus kowalevskii TaxID=10224 RepID=A0ABM0GNP2_SACKO|nr:PREDICTED: uncharacterized protein LOC100375170 [Saccoglossus kowalevskii]
MLYRVAFVFLAMVCQLDTLNARQLVNYNEDDVAPTMMEILMQVNKLQEKIALLFRQIMSPQVDQTGDEYGDDMLEPPLIKDYSGISRVQGVLREELLEQLQNKYSLGEGQSDNQGAYAEDQYRDGEINTAKRSEEGRRSRIARLLRHILEDAQQQAEVQGLRAGR